MTIRLTDSAIGKAAREVAATARRREMVDVACQGLRLRLSPAGTKTWALACRDRLGRMRRFGLGAYPTMGISEAREAARALHMQVKNEGRDPIAEKRRERAMGQAAKRGTGTLSALLDDYGNGGVAPASWPESRKRVDLVFKKLLALPLAVLTLADLQIAADSYKSAQSAAFAVRCIRPALKWAAAPGRACLAADLARISPPATVQRRKRVLSRDELAAILPALRVSRSPYATALRLLLLTLTRRSEICGARWRDVDLINGTLTIPETKNGEPHSVPLSRQAIEIMRDWRPADARPEMLIFSSQSGGQLTAWNAATRGIQVATGTAGWHRHDLRRTGATMLGDMGELPDIIEAALNHTSIRSPLAATYNRSRYRPQVAAALQRLADALEGIEAGGAQVVSLHAN